MNDKVLSLVAAVSDPGIFGCTAMPQTGLICTSTNVIGVGMKVSAALSVDGQFDSRMDARCLILRSVRCIANPTRTGSVQRSKSQLRSRH